MYKIIGIDGQQYGPIGADQIRQWIAEKRVNAHTLAQGEGPADWRPLISFPEFAPILQVAPPHGCSFSSNAPGFLLGNRQNFWGTANRRFLELSRQPVSVSLSRKPQ